jgi:hypothetical protein
MRCILRLHYWHGYASMLERALSLVYGRDLTLMQRGLYVPYNKHASPRVF